MPDYNKINLSNVKFEGDPFDVNEGVMPEEVPEPTFDPTNLSTSSVTPTDDDEIITDENGTWVRKSLFKLWGYIKTKLGLIDNDDSNKYLKKDGSWATLDIRNDVTGILSISNGGTNASTTAKARQNLFDEDLSSSVEYIIGITTSWAKGGYLTLQQLRNKLGLGNTTGLLLIANGGTGAANATNARNNLGITPITLWTGSAGNATGITNGFSITLNQSYKNFRTLRFYCKVNYANRGIESRRYIRDISTQQINEIRSLNNANNTVGVRWGWQAETEYIDIIHTSTDTVLRMNCNLTILYKVEGLQI